MQSGLGLQHWRGCAGPKTTYLVTCQTQISSLRRDHISPPPASWAERSVGLNPQTPCSGAGSLVPKPCLPGPHAFLARGH